MPVKIAAILEAKPGSEQALESLLRHLVAPSRAEAGNLKYDLWQDSADPKRFVLDELYTDEAAIAAHRASAHFQDYVKRVADIAVRTAYVCHPLDVAE